MTRTILGVVLVVVVALAAVTVARVRSRARTHAPDPQVMKTLRERVFEVPPEQLGAATSNTEPFAIVMDLGMENGTASVFAASSGDASLYLSTGGGVIGGFAHENVRHAATAFVRESVRHRNDLKATREYSYPTAGHVRFYVRNREGVFVADRSEEELGNKKDRLWPLFYAGQEVITQLRSVSGQ